MLEKTVSKRLETELQIKLVQILECFWWLIL